MDYFMGKDSINDDIEGTIERMHVSALSVFFDAKAEPCSRA